MVSDTNAVVVRRIFELPENFEQFLHEAAAEGFDRQKNSGAWRLLSWSVKHAELTK